MSVYGCVPVLCGVLACVRACVRACVCVCVSVCVCVHVKHVYNRFSSSNLLRILVCDLK